MGFKIVRDYTAGKGEASAKGTESMPPRFWIHRHFDKADEDYTYNGGQIKVRLRDYDGYVCFHALVDDTDFSCELVLDWAMNYAGATMLDLNMDTWNEESKGRQHPYPSKDGKWVYYM